MTLIASIFEKCTGSNVCDPLKDMGTDSNDSNEPNTVASPDSNANSNPDPVVANPANDLLEQTIAENDAKIAELMTRIETMEARRIEMEAELERNDTIEDSYLELQREYEALVEETDEVTARNTRISNVLTASRAEDAAEDAVVADLRAQLATKSDQINSLNDSLNAMMGQLKEKDSAITERNGVITEMIEEISQGKDALITENNVRITELSAQSAAKDLVITEKAEEIARLTSELGKSNTRVTDLSAQVNLLTAQLNDANLGIEERIEEIEGYEATISEKEAMISEKEATISEQADNITQLTEENTQLTEENTQHTTTIEQYTERFNDLKEKHEELAHKYYVLTHTHHSASAVEIIVPGLTYKPEVAEYVRLYGFPEDFVFDDVKLDAIRWDMYGECETESGSGESGESDCGCEDGDA